MNMICSHNHFQNTSLSIDDDGSLVSHAHPLSSPQQAVWFDQAIHPSSSNYNLYFFICVEGELNEKLFTRAFEAVVYCHDALRLRLINTHALPVQKVVNSLPVTVDIHDFSSYSDAEIRVKKYMNTEFMRPFHLNEVLWRSKLLRVNNNCQYWQFCCHHLIIDGTGLFILVNKVIDAYNRLMKGETLNNSAHSYLDFIADNLDYLASEHYSHDMQFWMRRYDNLPPPLLQPVHSNNTISHKQAKDVVFQPIVWSIDQVLFKRIEKTVGGQGLPLLHFMYAVLACYFARTANVNEIVIGIPVHNRKNTRQKHTMGMFASVLPIGVTISPEDTLRDVMQKAATEMSLCYEHQRFPIVDLNRQTHIQQKVGNARLFDVTLSLEPFKANLHMEGEGTNVKLFDLHSGAPYPLSVRVKQYTNTAHPEDYSPLSIEFYFSPDYMSITEVMALQSRLAVLLDSALTSLEMPSLTNTKIANLSILPDTERQQILVDFNATQTEFPQDMLVHQLFEAQVQRTPDAIAVVFEKQSLSYDELNKRANRLAHHLITLGVRPDDRVAICIERSLEMMIGLLGILKAGGAFVPLDPTYPTERLTYMLNDSAPVALITQTMMVETWNNNLPTILLDTQECSVLGAKSEENPIIQAMGLTSHHLAYVIYTSGSTGHPKGVMIEHHSLCNLITTQQDTLAITPDSRILQFASNSFDACIWECCMALLAGSGLYLAKRDNLLPGTTLSHYLETHAITHALLSPTILATMDTIPATLQTLLVGGEACPPTLVKRWAQGRQMINAYGPTEATVCATIYLCKSCRSESQEDSDNRENHAPPIGHPIPNTQIYILDIYGQPVPLGVAGEIYIAGVSVARGYLNRPELTAKCFLTDPFSSAHSARMYKTGDLGRWLPDGNIEYLGRNDFQVKLRGFRIEPGEIEARLRQCHGVREAVVLPCENLSGESLSHENLSAQKHLVAYLLPEADVELEPMALRQQLSQHLAEYMIPSAFVTLNAFPLTPNGKLDRQALPKPDHTAIVTRSYQAPIGEAETTLSQIWQMLLGVKCVSRYDHFFELGGHSLIAVSLIEKLRDLGWTLDIRNVFTKPVLSEMAKAILSAQKDTDQGNMEQEHAVMFTMPPNLIPDGCTAITPDMLTLVSLSQHEINAIVATIPDGAANIQDIYPLSPLQEGILFHYLLQKQGDTYLLRNLLAFDTREQLDTFLAALQLIINRHDILHTSIYWQGLAQPMQVVWRQASLNINTFLPNSEQDIPSQLLSHTDPHQYRLDVSQAPLFSADIVYHPHQGEWLLALCLHHLICDHMTLERIIDEIDVLLRSHTESGHLDNLPAEKLPPVLPYRNFVAQSLYVPASDHEAYFRKEFSDIDVPTAPFGILDIHSGDRQISETKQPLDTALSKAIRTQARRQGVSSSILFHVALALVLAKTSGRDDVVFGTVLLGRMQGSAGIDQVMGLLINTLPIRIRLTGNSTQTTVQETYLSLMRLLEHEQATLTQAQHCSSVIPPLPLFNTLLNYRHSQSDTTLAKWKGIRLLMQEERSNYPIGLFVDDWGDGFSLVAQTVSDIEPIRLINYMTTALTGLVEALGTSPHQPILDISILPVRERQQLLVDFNTAQSSQDFSSSQNTAANFPQNALIHQVFEKQVQHNPDAIAVVFEEQSLSYDELNQRANRLAHYLIALGVCPDDRVAICSERSPVMVVGLLAILKAGGAYVPLDPSYPAERLAYILEDAAPVALLTQTTLLKPPTSTVPIVDLNNLASLTADMPTNNPAPQTLGLISRHLAYVMYTSGSTGLPKGVMNEHRSVVNCLLWAQETYQLTPQDRVLQKTPFSFDVSVWELFPSLMFGAQLILACPDGHKDPHYLLSEIERRRITIIHFVPAMLQQFLNAIPAGRCPSLRHILCSGEAFPYALQQKCLSHFAHCQLYNLYGPTEAAIHVTAWQCVSDRYIGQVPIGKPIANTQIYLLDNHGEPVPIGVTGELYIGGVGVARGYLNLPELTAEHFLSDPFSTDPDARLYKSGDLARWLPDGNIEYLGRNDFQVKIRGFRIELGEIEARLVQCHNVREAVVIAREDASYEKTGGEKRLVAYLLAEPNTTLISAELRQQLAQHLAEYMLPSAFVTLDAFPLTPNGKLNRQALPIPDQTALVTRNYEAPIGDMETGLAEIWQELLKLEQVGRHDHFFELGGHSLLTIQLAARIRQKLARELRLQQLFAHPVLTDLAAKLTDTPVTTQIVIPATERSQPLPLSFSQQRLWFLTRLNTEVNLAYQIPIVMHLSGYLDHAAFTAALDRLVSRHESLRTRFVLIDEQPYQHIDAADIGFALTHHDLRSLDGTTRITRIDELMELETQTPFNFTSEPLIRGRLLQLANEEHRLILTQHHIITDGWSMGILFRELGALYRAALGGNAAPLPPLPIQYADYAVWQQKWLQGEVLTEQQDFWQKQLQNAPTLLALPTDRSRPPEQGYSGDLVPVRLNADLLSALKALGQRQDTTLFMTLLAAWGIVLARLSGQDDIVIGTPVANRSQSELEGLIGFFVNTLPLRVELESSNSVADLLAHVRERALAAYAHQDLPFEQLVEILQPERSLSYSPIFQVMLALNNTATQPLELSGLAVSLVEQPHRSAYFDLTLSLTETMDGLNGYLEYATDLFDRTTVERMVGYLTSVLTAMTTDETQTIARLPILSASERQQLLVEFNPTQTDIPQDMLIHQLFEAQAQRTPDATAVVFEEQSLSYHDLNHRANQLAHSLIAFGVRPDDRVAIHVERGLDMIIGLFGILKAGAGYIPLDPEYPSERLVYQLSDCKPVILLTQKHLQTCLPIQDIPIWLLDDETHQSHIKKQPVHNPGSEQIGLQPHHLAYIIYTSGSTGHPKGVMLEHHNVVSLIHAQFQVSEPQLGDRILQFVTVAFDISVSDIFPTLASGATLVLRPPHIKIPNITFVDFLREQKVTIINIPTAFWHHWVQEMRAGRSGFSPYLRTVIVGGDKVEPRYLMDWLSCPEIQSCRWINAYGPTEITVTASTMMVDRNIMVDKNMMVDNKHLPSITNNIPIGRPLSNTRIYILDALSQPVPIGVSGEIYIGGMGVARGYSNQPELTAEKFVVDPFSEHPNARMYKTGDLARWRSDGNIEYLGRNDFQVKLRGFRIELGEIETRLMQCYGVREAIVLAREDASYEKTGGDKRLVAYLIAEPNTELVPAELRQQLAQHLAEYMLPSAFVTLDAFPLAPNGKLDRQALPMPDQASIVTRAYEAPLGDREIALAEIWQILLELEKVGRYDNFFELGGHSLMVISLIERLRNLGWSLDIRTVFSAPTLAEMAKVMQVTKENATTYTVPPNLIPDGCTAITPDMLPLVSLTQHEIDTIAATLSDGVTNIQDIYPLAPLQEGMLFHHLLQTQGDVYLLHTLFAFDTRDRLDAFLAALQQIINRHDILRTAICWEGLTQPVQVVWRQASLHINTFMPDNDKDVPSQLLAHTDPYRHRLDVSQAPLFSADIAYDPHQGEWLLAFCCHHILNDHVSLGLIIAEINELLHQSTGQLPPALPYRHFIAQSLHAPISAHEAFFREMLADVDTPTAPFGILDVYSGDRPITEVIRPLNAALSRSIRKQASHQGVSPGALFHVAWAQVLAKISGRDDVVFGTVLLGRMQESADLEHILGLFINTLPVRFQLAENSVQATVQEAYRSLARLLEHEQAPLAAAQRCSGVTPPLPLFNALLNYRHSQLKHSQSKHSKSNTTNTGWEGIHLVTGQERTHYPLYLAVDNLGKSFLLSAQAVSGIDPSRLIGYMTTALASLVEALENQPQRPIMDIAIMSATERQQLLADFKATQADYPQDPLILAPDGKYDHQALPTSEQPAAVASGYEAPIGDVETVLAQIWQKLLKLEQVGRHDNFFALGGHSLIAIQLLARMREQGMEIPLATLFTHPSLCELAKVTTQVT
ncbi:amino acid adenylation domain-containing protein [Xenorhabdus sp. XENO-10]|uniref:Amino acid adenylation domain-containing protein n=2 Tax=Xenorhabdus yunnanensis TaxID=3025878 RepID=A0ABT5LCW6_9GAMM|nr:non-ribosomal peptide synthetase [Xenorhabdus yunnanensis]MDC9588815.1 amino acid adenylation domain-containing protein [Xenorhabdus yunnanensis]